MMDLRESVASSAMRWRAVPPGFPKEALNSLAKEARFGSGLRSRGVWLDRNIVGCFGRSFHFLACRKTQPPDETTVARLGSLRSRAGRCCSSICDVSKSD